MHHPPTGTVTLLFTDMEGSTHLLQQLGDRSIDALAECRHLLRMAFHQYHGHEVNMQGDSFFVAFARASDAVSAAVEAQRALAAHNWPQGVEVRVRMGLHTGEPQLAAEGYVGLDVHRASRIMSAGHGEQVLLSQTTRDLVEHDLPDGVSLRDLGAHRLKDLEHPTHLYQLVTPGLPADFPPLRTLDTHAHHLPVQLTPLIGRQREVAAVQPLLQREDVRLLTLTGAGGTGKTRLGLQVAAELLEEFSDGVYFVNLAPISDPELVTPAIAQALGIKEASGQPLLDLVSASLREKDLLLLLDNFEQVIGAAVEVATLLARCPRLKVLVTSRAALHVRGEQEFAVPPLAVPDPRHLPDLLTLSQYEAVALFIARAQAVKPDFQVSNATAPAVAEICARLDGLPLAIELAAARLKLLPPQALLARLGQRLAVLTGGVRDAPARQQTLRNTIAWSYHLLDAEEQRLFRHLSVFVGGCTLDAIEAACGNGALSVLDGVTSLLDKSLLRQIEQVGEEPRLTMLETVREYGLDCLRESREVEQAQRAHALYYLALAERAVTEQRSMVWFERLEQEHGNLRAALDWLLEQATQKGAQTDHERALRLAGALSGFWHEAGHVSEGRKFLERALVGSEGVAVAVRAEALRIAGNLAGRLGDYDRGEALCQESLTLFREVGDTPGVGDALSYLGLIGWYKGDLAAARSRFEESVALAREEGDMSRTAWSLIWLSQIYIVQGEHTQGRSLAEAALALYKELNDTWGIVRLRFVLADEHLYCQGDVAKAAVLYQENLVIARERGYGVGEGAALLSLGAVSLYRGDLTMARSLLEESAAFLQDAEDQGDKAWFLFHLARLAALEGNDTTARALYEECLTITRKTPFINTPFYLEGLAAVVARQGELTWAARLWGAAESLRTTLGTPLPPIERPAYEHAIAAARTQFGEQTFAAAWAEGRAMTADQVLVAREPASMPEPVSTAKPPPALSFPNDLTPREVEVLRLVAAGYSNQEIADRLVISERTVNSHLVHIFNKLGVNSRAAAAAFAIRQKLAE